MSDEGVFRPPGAPGGELHRWQPPGSVAHQPTQPAADPGPGHPPPDRGEGTGHRISALTRCRLAGVAAAVAVGLTGGLPYLHQGLPWFGFDHRACTFGPHNPIIGSQQEACASAVRLDLWQASHWTVWFAFAVGIMLLVRLARRGGPVWDLLAPFVAALAGVLAVRAMFTQGASQLDLMWAGPVVVLPLLAGLVVASATAYRLAQAAGAGAGGSAGRRWPAALTDGSLRMPGWLRPASIWRRRRRWLVGAGVLGVVLVAHGCAQFDAPGPGTEAGTLGGRTGPGGTVPPTGAPSPTGAARSSPAPPPGPDGAHLLAATRRAVADAHTVRIHARIPLGAGVTADLQLTSTGRAAGTVVTNRTYDVRRIGDQCWIRGLPQHVLSAWVRTTCTIPAYLSSPAIDLAALTDWRIMVTALPDPTGAQARVPAGDGRWQITAADGSTVYLTGARRPDPLPDRVRSAQPRPGGARDIDYSGWNDPAAITPP